MAYEAHDFNAEYAALVSQVNRFPESLETEVLDHPVAQGFCAAQMQQAMDKFGREIVVGLTAFKGLEEA